MWNLINVETGNLLFDTDFNCEIINHVNNKTRNSRMICTRILN